MVQGVSYEAYSDTLVVATFGRGINRFPMHLQVHGISHKFQVYTLYHRQSARLQNKSPASWPYLVAVSLLPSLHHRRFGYLCKKNARIDCKSSK
jgi:hypothetical protein